MDLKDKQHLRWEQALLRRAKSGDDAAFAELYKAYAPMVFARVLLPKLGRRAAAEDALSETFRKGYERLGQFQAKEVSVYYWFARIAANKATDMHRAQTRSRRALGAFETMLLPLLPKPLGPDERLDGVVAQQMLAARVRTVLAQVNPRYRRAIELRFLEDRKRAECAEIMNVKLGTFDVLVLRALKAFRKTWETFDD